MGPEQNSMDHIVRQIKTQEREIYLTFDDGPDVFSTPHVLKVLSEKNVKATFFVVAEKAKKNIQLLNEILGQGHAIGNHSLDHTYGVFFRGRKKMLKWIQDSELVLVDLGIKSHVGFRPPNGIVTPKLVSVLEELQIPLVLWNQRYYDAIIPWTKKRALQLIPNFTPGSVILLHDRQSEKKCSDFCEVLGAWIDEVKAQGFKFGLLSRELCKKQIL